jgi:hypothetical protein
VGLRAGAGALEKTKALSPSDELLNKAMADPNVCLMFNNSESGFT